MTLIEKVLQLVAKPLPARYKSLLNPAGYARLKKI